MRHILIKFVLTIIVGCSNLFAADMSIYTAYASFKDPVTDSNIEAIIRSTQFFKKFIDEERIRRGSQARMEKFIRSKIAIPTHTEIPVLLEVQNDKIATAAKKIYTRLMTTPVAETTLNQVKKDLRVIKTLQDQYGLQKASEILNTQDITQKLQPKTLEIETTEQLETLKKLDGDFAQIIVRTKIDNLTGQMLIDAKKALTDFRALSSQLNDQARKEAQALFGGTDLDSYIQGMESAFKKRLETIPDALSLILKEQTN